jgi:hypothetical protein
MSRSGYSDDYGIFENIKWRGQVASASRGKRGQAFFLDLIRGLDSLTEKKLISQMLQCQDGMCALGVVGYRRGIDLSPFNPKNGEYEDDDSKTGNIANILNIAPQLARETVYINDEANWENETPEKRWIRVRSWAVSNIGYIFEDDKP